MESYKRFDEIFKEIEELNRELKENQAMDLSVMMEKAKKLKALTREGNQILDTAKREIHTIFLDTEETEG
jgi:hypothetical protein